MEKLGWTLLIIVLSIGIGYAWRWTQEGPLQGHLHDAKELIKVSEQLRSHPGTMWIQLSEGQWICMSTKQLTTERY